MFKRKNTKVIVVYPPDNNLAGKSAVELKIDAALETIAASNKITLLHYDRDTSFTPNLFTDQWHLNLNGTALYSRKLGNDIKAIISNSIEYQNY